MRDIVERLRHNTPRILDSGIRLEAAAEIERLRDIVEICLDRYIPFREVELRQRANAACGNPLQEANGLRVREALGK